jgi:hypothetical protein
MKRKMEEYIKNMEIKIREEYKLTMKFVKELQAFNTLVLGF